MEKLESCPVCGKGDYVKAYDKFTFPEYPEHNKAPHVICGYCSCRVLGFTKQDAINVWNKGKRSANIEKLKIISQRVTTMLYAMFASWIMYKLVTFMYG